MNLLIISIIFLIIFSTTTILPVLGVDETRIIISEIDDEIFKAALNSKIISTDGKVIGQLEIANPDEIGQVFVLEQKNKEKNLDEIELDTWISLGSLAAVSISLFVSIWRGTNQQKTHDKLEFSKLLNDFEHKWTEARLDWKNDDDGKTDYDNCYAMCSKRLSLLDSIAFLTTKEKIDSDMLSYFAVHFTEGMLYEIWISGIEENEKGTWKHFSQYVYDNDKKPASVKLLPKTFSTVFTNQNKNNLIFDDAYVLDIFTADKQKFDSDKQ